tara:strand:- start:3864 stop:5102 length:1239 start_codon:yes stop_codon:yes gene_type:complete
MTEDGKYKVVVLSDHALSTSGVGTQTRHLIEGLLKKDCWSFRQFGAALKHSNYDTTIVNKDFIIKPIDGFGDQDLIRRTLVTEKPDLIFIFTDPRFFVWLFEMEDEIHQVCPIVWWHVWDNYPYPKFNDAFYQATDLINCHSHMTYEMLKDSYPEKTNFVPHSLPPNLFFKMSDAQIKDHKVSLLGKEREDHFVGIWVNRNAKRKRPSDLLEAWSKFLDTVPGRKATLIMHTEPTDREGPNLFEVVNMYGIKDNVFFSRDRLEFDQMNVLYNISDFCINTSYAEGFGLSTLEAMMTGTPIIAPKTGGLTRQVLNPVTLEENGVAIDIDLQTLVGNQSVPYIYEDYVKNENFTKAIKKIHDMTNYEKEKLSIQVLSYANTMFKHQNTIDLWHKTMIDTIKRFKTRESWTVEVL